MKLKIEIFCFLFFLITVSELTCFAQIQSAEVTNKFYKDPDIEINTPGFKISEGFMKYPQMKEFLDSLSITGKDFLRMEYCGVSEFGRKIPVVYIGNKKAQKTLKIWMQGGLHGNEPASTESVLMFIQYLVKLPNLQKILNELSFAFIPMANIDGYENQMRDNKNGADLNRDQVTLLQPESIYLKQAFTNFAPHVAIDFHEFRPFRKELEKVLSIPICLSQDVLFLPSGNLNVPEIIRNLTSGLFLNNIGKTLSVNGLSFDNYFVPVANETGEVFLQMGGDSPRSSSTSYALANAISILFEIRGINLGRESYKRRVFSGFLIAREIMKTSIENKKQIIKVVNQAIKETVSGKADIVLNSKPRIYNSKMNFIDTGKNEITEVNIQIQNTGSSTSTEVRKRPSGYILLPENASIVTKLQTLGVKTDTLKKNTVIDVEVFEAQKPYSDSVANIRFFLKKETKSFPAGSFLVSTKQRNGNIVVSTLEPEMENGFFRYKMLKMNPGGEATVYRYNSKSKIIHMK